TISGVTAAGERDLRYRNRIIGSDPAGKERISHRIGAASVDHADVIRTRLQRAAHPHGHDPAKFIDGAGWTELACTPIIGRPPLATARPCKTYLRRAPRR